MSILHAIKRAIESVADAFTGNRVSRDIPANMRLTLEHPDRTDESGVFLGVVQDNSEGYYVGKRAETDGNIMLVGSNGSGKSHYLLKSTIETWRDPFVALDIKGELLAHYKYLSLWGYAKRPYVVFDPSRGGMHYDVYALLRKDKRHTVQYMREIVEAIIPIPSGTNDAYWIDLARDLLTGAMLYYYEQDIGFIETMSLLQVTSAPELCKKIMAGGSVQARLFIANLIAIKPAQCASIGSEINRYIRIFATDLDVQAALSPDDDDAGSFSWDSVLSDPDAPNVFLCVNQDRLEQWSGVLRLMMTQLIRNLERRPEKYSPHGTGMKPILLLMDEFPMLGKMDVMQNAITTLRSKKVAFYIALQSIAQLDALYGENVRKILMDNCQFKAILQVSDPDSQKYFSEMFGSGLCPKTSVSSSWNTESDGITLGTHIQEEREPRIYPQDFATNDDILLQTPYGVFRVKKQAVVSIRPYYWMETTEVDSVQQLSFEHLSRYVRSETRNDLKQEDVLK